MWFSTLRNKNIIYATFFLKKNLNKFPSFIIYLNNCLFFQTINCPIQTMHIHFLVLHILVSSLCNCLPIYVRMWFVVLKFVNLKAPPFIIQHISPLRNNVSFSFFSLYRFIKQTLKPLWIWITTKNRYITFRDGRSII